MKDNTSQRKRKDLPEDSKVVAFAAMTEEEKIFRLSVVEVFRQGIQIPCKIALEPIFHNTEDLVGVLPENVRSAFHHFCNITFENDRITDEHELAIAELKRLVPPKGNPGQLSNREMTEKIIYLDALTRRSQALEARFEIEFSDMQQLIWNSVPLLRGKKLAIKADYEIVELTLPKDRPWVARIAPHDRCRIAALLLDAGHDPTQIDEELVMSEIDAMLEEGHAFEIETAETAMPSEPAPLIHVFDPDKGPSGHGICPVSKIVAFRPPSV